MVIGGLDLETMYIIDLVSPTIGGAYTWLISKDQIQEQMLDFKKGVLSNGDTFYEDQIRDCVQIDFTHHAPVEEIEIRWLFQNRLDVLQVLKLWRTKERLEHLEADNIMYFLTTTSGSLWLIDQDNVEDVEINHSILDGGNINYERSFKIKYEDYRFMDHDEIKQIFGSYLDKKFRVV